MIKTGTYVGDGTAAKAIAAAPGGTLRQLEIIEQSTGQLTLKSETMPGAMAFNIPGQSNDNDVMFSGANFIVDGTVGSVNALGLLYHWIAFLT